MQKISKNEFLELWFRNGANLRIGTLFLSKDSDTRTTEYFEKSEILDLIPTEKEFDSLNVFYEINNTSKPIGNGKRAKTADIDRVNGFYLDLDLDQSGLDPEQIDSLQQGLVDRFSSVQIDVNFIVRSGGGIHAYFQSSQPIIISSDEERAQTQCLVSELSHCLHALAAHWFPAVGTDKVSDLARMARLPGSMNQKREPKKLVQAYLVSEIEHDFSKLLQIAKQTCEQENVTFNSEGNPPNKAAPMHTKRATSLTSVDAISTRLKEAERDWQHLTEDLRHAEAAFRKSGGNGEALENLRKVCAQANPRPVFESCHVLSQFVAKRKSLSRQDWLMKLNIAYKCYDGHELIHALSEGHPDYSKSETAEQAKSTAKAGPILCETFSKSSVGKGCLECPFRGSISTPLQLGKDTLKRESELLSDYGFNATENEFVKLKTGASMKGQAFERVNALDKGMADFLVRRPSAIRFMSSITPPANQHGLLSVGGDRIWNTHIPSPMTGSAGACPNIENFIEFVLPQVDERELFKDMIAFHFQNQHKKIRWAPLLISAQGVGKNTLVEKLIFGCLTDTRHHCRTESTAGLKDDFNARLGDVGVLYIDELWTTDKRDSYNRLKPLITSDTIPLNQKNKAVRQGDTPRLVILSSNYGAPIKVDADDRRLFVLEMPREKANDDLYAQFYKHFDQEREHFIHAMMTRDVSSFSPDKAPPMTASKRRLLTASLTEVEQWLIQMIEKPEGIFVSDILLAKDIAIAWNEASNSDDVSAHKISKLLASLDHVQLQEARYPSGKGRPWVIRNHDHWQNQSVGIVRRYLSRSANDDDEVFQMTGT